VSANALNALSAEGSPPLGGFDASTAQWARAGPRPTRQGCTSVSAKVAGDLPYVRSGGCGDPVDSGAGDAAGRKLGGCCGLRLNAASSRC
jgi:hypothetical protein